MATYTICKKDKNSFQILLKFREKIFDLDWGWHYL